MRVRILLNSRGEASGPRLRSAALAFAALLTPLSLIAFTIFLWSLAAEFHWTSNFPVSRGLFSHWQMWLVMAATLLATARLLNRYADRSPRAVR